MNILRKHILTVTREDPGHYGDNDGIWYPGDTSTFTIRASVQPLRPDEIELLPDGRRMSEAFRIYTATPLRLAVEGSNENADKVEIYGNMYEVFSQETWQNKLIDHYKIIVLKI